MSLKSPLFTSLHLPIRFKCLTNDVHSLSEDPDITVGVIEAGEYVTDMMSIMVPGAFARQSLTFLFLSVESETRSGFGLDRHGAYGAW